MSTVCAYLCVCMYIKARVCVIFFTPGPLLTRSHLETAAPPSRPGGGPGLDFGLQAGSMVLRTGGDWVCGFVKAHQCLCSTYSASTLKGVCVYVCVCLCVWVRERGRKGEQWGKEKNMLP